MFARLLPPRSLTDLGGGGFRGLGVEDYGVQGLPIKGPRVIYMGFQQVGVARQSPGNPSVVNSWNRVLGPLYYHELVII